MPPRGKAFSRLAPSDPDELVPAAAAGTIYGSDAEPIAGSGLCGSTRAQTRWLWLLLLGLAADMLVVLGLYLVTPHQVARPSGAGKFRTDTVDLVYLGVARVVMVIALSTTAVVQGIPDRSSLPPHKRSTAERQKEDHAKVWRRGSVVAVFFILTVCSVFSGAKCVVFDFPDAQTEYRLAPLMAMTIGLINIQFWLMKKLVKSHERLVNSVRSHMHQHPLTFFPTGVKATGGGGPGGGRGGRGGGGGGGPGGPGTVCDVCRANCANKRAYGCPDCRFNLCEECFEMKDALAAP